MHGFARTASARFDANELIDRIPDDNRRAENVPEAAASTS